MQSSQTSEEKGRTYIAIDLKSFYASVECVARGLDPLTTNLVVADPRHPDHHPAEGLQGGAEIVPHHCHRIIRTGHPTEKPQPQGCGFFCIVKQ